MRSAAARFPGFDRFVGASVRLSQPVVVEEAGQRRFVGSITAPHVDRGWPRFICAVRRTPVIAGLFR